MFRGLNKIENIFLLSNITKDILMKKVAIVLSGCGFYDGSEINEVVLTLLALENSQASYQCFAPDMDQYEVINHCAGIPINGKRNVLIESARIVRGDIAPLVNLHADDFDALIVPGGFGVVKNLSTFAYRGDQFSINKQFEQVMVDFKEKNKVVGYMCIAPLLLAKIYPNIRCTIGSDKDIATLINCLGGQHINCGVDDVVIDTVNKVISTPAYMLASTLVEAQMGINKLVSSVLAMCI